MQILYRSEGKQPKLGMTFRGKGRVRMDEKLACHKSVNVFFQTNAWIDIDGCRKWTDTTLSTFVEDDKLEKFLLYLITFPTKNRMNLRRKFLQSKDYVDMV